jgi:hypothetical protein
VYSQGEEGLQILVCNQHAAAEAMDHELAVVDPAADRSHRHAAEGGDLANRPEARHQRFLAVTVTG